jgi:hypothetical protein
MKTLTSARTLALLAAALALGSFNAVALAGPGPQYWNKAPAAAPTAPTAPPWAGCTTTTPFASNDRGPNGRGAHDAAVANTIPSRSVCPGTIATAKGQTKDTLSRTAAYGTILCCT